MGGPTSRRKEPRAAVHPGGPKMNVIGLLASCAAAVSLWLGASRQASGAPRGDRWLAGAAVFWFAGLLADQLFAGSFGSGPLSLADVAPLLAVGPLVVGVTALAAEPPDGGWPDGVESPMTAEGADARSILSALADGYVMAIALLVIGWVTLFGADYPHSGEGGGAFLLGLVHPLVDAAVLGMLLPALTSSWRRVGLPYLAVLTIGVGDALGVGSRLASGHMSTAQQVTQVLAFVLLGLTPWMSRAHVPEMRRLPRSIPGSGRIGAPGRGGGHAGGAGPRGHGQPGLGSGRGRGQPARGPGRDPGRRRGPAGPGGPGPGADLGDQRGAAGLARLQRQPA